MARARPAPFPPSGPIVAFAGHLVDHDLPALPDDRRHAVAAFAQRRVAGLPTPMRLGVGVVALVVDGAGRLVGRARLTSFLADHPVPLFGEYVRLIRSLAYAYVWDTWPATAFDGAPTVVGGTG